MAATNTDLYLAVVEEVSTLGVITDDGHLLDVEEEDIPSASEIASAQTVVTPLGDMLTSQTTHTLTYKIVTYNVL